MGSSSSLSVVFCIDGARAWYRDVIICENELYCSPRVSQNTAHARCRPTGEYDIAAYLKTLPAPWNDPSLLVIHDDGGKNSIVRNLSAVKCPKVFIVADTHHYCALTREPIWRPVEHSLAEKFDLIVGEFTRHHMHFFHEAAAGAPGTRVAWHPSFIVSPFEHAPGGPRPRGATFVGGTQKHPYRKHVLETLIRSGVPIEALSASQQDSATIQSQSKVNINISLNGDFNLRVFEILAAGGFLLTERMSPESGLSLLFEDHKHLVMFDDADQLAELIPYYLGRQDIAEKIAAAGHAEYMRRHRPAIKAQELVEMVNGKVPELYDIALDRRTALRPESVPQLRKRILLYELLQEWHRTNLRLDVLFWLGAERHATDAIDLARMHPTLVHGGEGGGLLGTAQLVHRVAWIDRASPALEQGAWHVLVCPAAALGDPGLLRCIAARKLQAMVLTDFEAVRDMPALQALAQRYGLSKVNDEPMAVTFAAAGA